MSLRKFSCPLSQEILQDSKENVTFRKLAGTLENWVLMMTLVQALHQLLVSHLYAYVPPNYKVFIGVPPLKDYERQPKWACEG